MKDKELKMALTKDASVEKIKSILIKYPTAIKSVNKFSKRLALHWACINETPIEVVKVLVENYPDAISQTDKMGMTPLHYVCGNANNTSDETTTSSFRELALLLVEQCPEVLRKVDDLGRTPLHLACTHQTSLSKIDCLVEHCPPEAVMIQTKEGMTALELACTRSTSDWDTPEDRHAILELLQNKERDILLEAQRKKREKEEGEERLAAEKKRTEEEEKEAERIRLIQKKEAAEEEEQRLEEKRQQNEEEVNEVNEEQIQSRLEAPSCTTETQREQQDMQSDPIHENSKDDGCEFKKHSKEKSKQQGVEKRVAAEEEKKSEELGGPRPVSLRDQPSPYQVADCFRPVALKPRLEPPPGLVVLGTAKKGQWDTAAQKEKKNNATKGHQRPEAKGLEEGVAATQPVQQEEQETKTPLEEESLPIEGNIVEANELEKQILDKIHQEAVSRADLTRMTESPDLSDSGRLARDLFENDETSGGEAEANTKRLFQKDRKMSRKDTPKDETSAGFPAAPITPESNLLVNQKSNQLPSVQLSDKFINEANASTFTWSRTKIPPGFGGDAKKWSFPTGEKESDSGMMGTAAADIESFSLFPDVNLQPLAKSLGYDRLFEFDLEIDEDCESPRFGLPVHRHEEMPHHPSQNKTLQHLKSELLGHSEESKRLREEQQAKWRREIKNNEEKTPLHLACAHKNPCIETIRLLADGFPSFLEKQDDHGLTPLHTCCEYNAPFEVIEFLVGKFVGAVQISDEFGNTPLHIACKKQCSHKVIQLLAQKLSESSS